MSDSFKYPSIIWTVIKSISSGTSDCVLPHSCKLENQIFTNKISILYKQWQMAHNFSDPQEKLPFDLNFAPITINEIHEALNKDL